MRFTVRGPKGHLVVRKISPAGLVKRLPALVRRFKHVTVATAPAPPVDHRPLVAAEARWGVANEPRIHYTESDGRDDWLYQRPRFLPLATDCSGFVTACYRWAGAPDPNGLDYKELGYTGTLLSFAEKHGHVFTDVARALPGDPIVIGPGTGDHVVVCVVAGHDPLVVSHGAEGGPRLQRLSVDRRTPKRVCRTLPS